MDKDKLSRKEKARPHIVEAIGLLPYMGFKKSDAPYYHKEYNEHISEAKKALKGVYPKDDVIFKELDTETFTGLQAALGGLGLGDRPFIEYKREAKDAEIFEAEEVEDIRRKFLDTSKPFEVEVKVYLTTDLLNVLPHTVAPLRLIFTNKVAKKALRLLDEQFEYDANELGKQGEWNIGSDGGELDEYIHWRNQNIAHGRMNDYNSELKWGSNRLPATTAFLQWNWAAIWCKSAEDSDIFSDGLFTRDANGYGWIVRNMKSGRDKWFSDTDEYGYDAKIGLQHLRNIHHIVGIESMKIYQKSTTYEWEDYGAPNSPNFTSTLFIDEILGEGCDWGIVNQERMK